MSNNQIARAERHARTVFITLGVIKWAVIAALCISGGLAVAVIALATSWPEWTLWLEAPVAFGSVVASVAVWALFGWMQAVLGLLAGQLPPAASSGVNFHAKADVR